MYIALNTVMKITFAETSFGEWLDKRCAEMGVHREPATYASRLGVMKRSDGQPFDIPEGSRFSIETVNYTAYELVEPGVYVMKCEEPGRIGNKFFGRLIPIETISGLASAELTDVLVPGEDIESDGSLFFRYEEAVNTAPFGGNIDDYKQKVKKLDGVGGCKVFPVWMGGGTVKVCFITTEYSPPSPPLIEAVQQAIDPVPFSRQGMGTAPIGHFVTVTGVKGVTIDISTTLVLKNGYALGHVEDAVKEIVISYFMFLASDWEREASLIVRINQIEAKILDVEGILDINGTLISGGTKNISLGAEEIPLLGQVALNV